VLTVSDQSHSRRAA